MVAEFEFKFSCNDIISKYDTEYGYDDNNIEFEANQSTRHCT